MGRGRRGDGCEVKGACAGLSNFPYSQPVARGNVIGFKNIPRTSLGIGADEKRTFFCSVRRVGKRLPVTAGIGLRIRSLLPDCNFTEPAKEIAAVFKRMTGHAVIAKFGYGLD